MTGARKLLRLPFPSASAREEQAAEAPAAARDAAPVAHDFQSVVRGVRAHFVLAAVLSAAINILYLAPSIYMLQVYDRVLVSSSALTLAFLSVAIVVALMCMAGLDAVRARVMSRMALRFDLRLAPTVLRADLDARGEGRGGSEVSGMRDLDTVRQTLASPAATTLMDLPWTPLFVIICFVVHPWVGLAALIGVFLLLGLALLNEMSSRKHLKLVSERAPGFYSALEGDMRAAETARATGVAGLLVRRRLREREGMLSAQIQAAFTAADYTASTKFVRMLLQSGMLGLGAFLAMNQQISPGAIIAVTILSARAFAPIEQVVGTWRQMVQGRLSLDTIRATLQKVEARAPRTALPAPVGPLTLEGLTGRAPGADRPTLLNASFRAEAGDIVGVVGPSGAGKTTLARLLANAATPVAGSLRIDGASYQDWDPEALARHIGYLPQAVDLMPGTVAENVSRFAEGHAGDPDALSLKIVEAAKAAGAHEMILRLPKGYDTPLGPAGRGLSMGQAQRVALARALFGSPLLLVLDEPNAHLDAEGEAALIGALKGHKARGGIAFVIAHRAGVMAVADRLIALQDGRIVEAGTRDAVAAKLGRTNAAPSASIGPAAAPANEGRANSGDRS